jgi:threonine synthase
MDIQISSNFERLLFESAGRDADAVSRMMAALKQSRGFELPGKSIAAIRAEFAAGTSDEATTNKTIAETWAKSSYLLDPHTAVGVAVARSLVRGPEPMITLATAHPAKFPAAVKAATGIEPGLPSWLEDLYQRPERVEVLANDQRVVENFIGARSRAA